MNRAANDAETGTVDEKRRELSHRSLHVDASFSDEMNLGSDGDASTGPAEPAVKRERIELSHPLQEM